MGAANWRTVLAHYAPWAHAWLFARTDDFTEVQALLAEALTVGFGGRSRRYFLTASTRTCLKTLERFLDAACAARKPRPEGGGGRTFASSPKLRALDRAVRAIRSFNETERMALVLLYVDEVPEPLIGEWLGLDAESIADLRTRLERTVEPEALERLRHYRVSEAFLATVLAKIDRGFSGAFTLGRVSLGILLFLFGAATLARRGPAERVPILIGVLYAMGLPGLLTSLSAVGALFWARWAIQMTAPLALSGDEGRSHAVRDVVTFAAGPLFLAHALVVFAPDVLLPGAARRFFSLPVDLWPLALVIFLAEIVALFTVLGHYLPAWARTAAAPFRFR